MSEAQPLSVFVLQAHAIGFSSLNQAVFNSVVGHIRIGFEPHFFQNSTAIGADGFHTQRQLIGDITGRRAARRW